MGMADSQSEPQEYPEIVDLPAPGPVRRRVLRQAGINLHLTDFTDQERAIRGFRRDPEQAQDSD